MPTVAPQAFAPQPTTAPQAFIPQPAGAGLQAYIPYMWQPAQGYGYGYQPAASFVPTPTTQPSTTGAQAAPVIGMQPSATFGFQPSAGFSYQPAQASQPRMAFAPSQYSLYQSPTLPVVTYDPVIESILDPTLLPALMHDRTLAYMQRYNCSISTARHAAAEGIQGEYNRILPDQVMAYLRSYKRPSAADSTMPAQPQYPYSLLQPQTPQTQPQQAFTGFADEVGSLGAQTTQSPLQPTTPSSWSAVPPQNIPFTVPQQQATGQAQTQTDIFPPPFDSTASQTSDLFVPNEASQQVPDETSQHTQTTTTTQPDVIRPSSQQSTQIPRQDSDSDSDSDDEGAAPSRDEVRSATPRQQASASASQQPHTATGAQTGTATGTGAEAAGADITSQGAQHTVPSQPSQSTDPWQSGEGEEVERRGSPEPIRNNLEGLLPALSPENNILYEAVRYFNAPPFIWSETDQNWIPDPSLGLPQEEHNFAINLRDSLISSADEPFQRQVALIYLYNILARDELPPDQPEWNQEAVEQGFPLVRLVQDSAGNSYWEPITVLDHNPRRLAALFEMIQMLQNAESSQERQDIVRLMRSRELGEQTIVPDEHPHFREAHQYFNIPNFSYSDFSGQYHPISADLTTRQ
ncbi:MAG: hypothetical protein ACRDAP_05850, partial [Shewanella sp.]